MTPVLIALGSAWDVHGDLEAVLKLVGDRPYEIGAAKWIGADFEGRLSLWASLHPEMAGKMQRARAAKGGNADYLFIAHKGGRGPQFDGGRIDRVMPQGYHGCSGLYLACKAVQLGYERVICCGMPLLPEPHFNRPEPWRDAARYHRGWRDARRDHEISTRVRSMSGWTAELFGRPNARWLDGEA